MPVEPRLAASLIIYNHTDTGELRFLMGKRHKDLRFMPGFLVFPGGKVEPEDIEQAQSIFTQQHIIQHKQYSISQLSLLYAALRECEEETGIKLTIPIADLLQNQPLACIMRAITPEFSPVRFDTYFLLLPAYYFSKEVTQQGELEDIRWWPSDELLTHPRIADVTHFVIEQAFQALQPQSALRSSPPLLTYSSYTGQISLNEDDLTGIF